MTLWPTCTAPPGGDFARCEHGAFPQSIAGGPDGAMWFTTARADLGRVTPAGGFAQVDVPLGAGGDRLLGGLTVGPDGNLWFPAAFGAPYLYRATAASPPGFSSTLNPGDTQPRQALLGPDGAIWFADLAGSRVGRLTTGALSAPAVVSLSPSAGPPGTAIRVDGDGLSRATAVTVGGRAATFKHSGSGLSVTAPSGTGAAPVVVTTAAGRSPATDAATFSFTGAAVPAPTAPPVTTAPTVTLGAASLAADGTLTVSVRTTAAAPFDVAAALPVAGRRATIATVSAKLALPRAGTAKGRFVRTGGSRVRVRLSAATRRAIARRGQVRLEVGVRLRLGGGQTSVGQRTYRLSVG